MDEGFPPANVDLVKVQELLVGLIVVDDAVVEAQRLLVVQADLLDFQLQGLVQQIVRMIEFLDNL